MELPQRFPTRAVPVRDLEVGLLLQPLAACNPGLGKLASVQLYPVRTVMWAEPSKVVGAGLPEAVGAHPCPVLACPGDGTYSKRLFYVCMCVFF